MGNNGFDFGALLNDQFKGVKRGYKFGKAFNEDKSLVRPQQAPVAAASDDNATILAAWNDGASVPGVVEKETKGGYEVTVAGQRAFCPFSQIDLVKREAAEYLGRKFDFIVTEYSKDDRGLNVIVSRRALQEIERQALREATLAQLTEGETLGGTVTKVLEFGAFVDLGGLEGLVPAREIAWERVDDPTTVLKAGDGITVKVLKVDREAGKVTLSRKECLARTFKRSPEDEVAERTAAEVSAWMAENEKKNSGFGCGAFDKL